MKALLIVLGCFQDPVPPPAPQVPTTLDVVVLKNGDRFEGRITAQLDGYVEMQLDAGQSIGLGMAQIAEVRRGGGALAPVNAPAMPPQDEWFSLHDAAGNAVGWLHASITNGIDGTFTISEEYEFVEGSARWQITSMCTADAGFVPRTCYFRERQSTPALASAPLGDVAAGASADRIVDERIVEATCNGTKLHVTRLDRSGRRERELDFRAGSTFPLLARALARHSGSPLANVTLFDPATEEVVTRTFDGARSRRVTIDGKALDVTEVTENTTSGRNSEWIDASARTVRRELAGPSLVAVPSSAGSAARAARGAAIPSAIVADVSGTFGLWIPNPSWQLQENSPAGNVALRCEPHGATIVLSRLDHLEKGTTSDTAADAVLNWFRLLQPALAVESRETVLVRDRSAVRLSCLGRPGKDLVRAVIDVIPHHDGYLALVCTAPDAAWNELAPDFDFVRRSIELEPQSIAPKLQGPLAPKPKGKAGGKGAGSAEAKKNGTPARRPTPPPVAQPAPAPRDSGPIVRIPNDQ